MSLRLRVLLAVAAVTVAAILGAAVVGRALIEIPFETLERQAAEAALQRARTALDQAAEDLSGKAADWAHWDDAWRFVAERDPAFISSNFVAGNATAMRLDAIAVLDAAGRPIEARGFDRARQEWAPLPACLAALRPGGKPLVGDGARGLLRDGDGWLLAAAHAITPSAGGATRGWMVFARRLDGEEISRLGAAAAGTVQALDPGPQAPPPGIAARGDRLGIAATILGLDDRPSLVLSVELERAIHAEGQRAARWLVHIAAIGGLATALAAWLLLELLVVRRSAALARRLDDIAARADASQRVEAMGADELGAVAKGINRVLDGLHRAQEGLRAAQASAEDANRAKDAFLATVTHELRTPLTGVLGMTDLMLAEDPAPGMRARLEVVRACGEDLLAHIDSILDLSKLVAGRLELDPRPLDPAALARQVIALHEPKARAKGLDLRLEADPALPPVVLADPLRLRQVLGNLIANAIKFTPHGAVTVAMRAAATDWGWNLEWEVRDTGPGIPPEVQARLFSAFTQAEASIARRHGGTGLGLAICRHLVGLMGGAIAVESQPGRGATFHFTVRAVPTDLAPDAESAPVAVERWPQARVLVADDQAVNRLVVEGLLARHGIRPDLAADGHEAVACTAGQAYDLLLLDLQMPELDGYATLGAIRDGEARGRRVPAVALTAHVLASQREECLRRGFDDHLPKPLRPAALAACLRRWLGAPTAASEAAPAAPAAQAGVYAALAADLGPETAATAIGELLTEVPDLLARARAALEGGDWAAAGRQGHTLKGSLGNLGLAKASSLARGVEDAARAADGPALAAALAELESRWQGDAAALAEELRQAGRPPA